MMSTSWQKRFNCIKKEGKINDAIIEYMLLLHRSGFKVYIGRILSLWQPGRYIIFCLLREEIQPYNPLFEGKNSNIAPKNTIFWQQDAYEQRI